MRARLLLIAVFLMMVKTAASSVLSAEGNRFTFTGPEHIVSFAEGKVSVQSRNLEVGEIDRLGLLRTLKSPYSSSFSLRPEIVPFSRSSGRSGVLLGTDSLSFGFSTGNRPLVFAYAGFEYFEGAVLYAFPGRNDGEGYLTERGAGTDVPMLYMAGRGGWKFFQILGVMSFSPEEGVELLGAAGIRHGKYSLDIIGGDTAVLYEGKNTQSWGLRLSIGETGFRSDISVVFGSPAIYSADFLPYKASVRSELELHGVRVYSSMEYSFSRKGRAHKRDCITVSWMGFEAGYDTSGGFLASYEHDIFKVGYENGRVYAEVELMFDTDDAELRLRLSSDGTIDTALSIGL